MMPMESKVCKYCKRSLPLSEFYFFEKHSIYDCKCKECARHLARENRQKKLEYYRYYDRNRPNKVERYEKRRERDTWLKENEPDKWKKQRELCRKNYREKHPNQVKANDIVNDALRRGKIIKPSKCVFCGSSEQLQAHHEDYSKPLDVLWLCIPCHVKRHYELKGDKKYETN